jgi:hypothetical protein
VVDEDFVSGAEATLTITDEGVTTVAYQASDVAGNAESEGTVTVRIDRTAPAVSLTVPASGATYQQGQAVTAAYACTDQGAGIEACAGDVASGKPLDTAAPGNRTFTVRARDRAGNATTRAVSYRVLAAPATVDLDAKPRQKLGTVIRDGIATRCKASVAGTCSVAATIRARDARRLGLPVPPKARWVEIGRAGATVKAGAKAAIDIRLGKRVRTALGHAQRLRVRLTATLTPAGGAPVVAKRDILLVRRL